MPCYNDEYITGHLTPTIFTNGHQTRELVCLQAPYDPALNQKYQKLGGRWDWLNIVWSFPAPRLAALRQLVAASFTNFYEVDMAGFHSIHIYAVMHQHLHDAAIYWLLPFNGTNELEQVTAQDPAYRPFADKVGAGLSLAFQRKTAGSSVQPMTEVLNELVEEGWRLASREGAGAVNSVYHRIVQHIQFAAELAAADAKRAERAASSLAMGVQQ